MTTVQQVLSAVGSVQLKQNTFKCEYCKKSFQKETTLLAHSCEKKRRW
jgi:aspartate carbamoyltransferase regulatory subunit